MRMMKALYILSILAALQVQHSPLVNGSEATINVAGDAIIADAADETAECQSKELLNGKLSSCDTFQIATLNASPRRCIHIEGPPPPLPTSDDDASDTDPEPEICKDYENWFDGTNGCSAYTNEGWCDKYGNMDYPATKYRPTEACCVCGGGSAGGKHTPRFQVGEYVKLKGYGPYDECTSLKIAEIGTQPKFHYLIEVMKPCGPKRMARDARGFVTVEQTFEAGKRLTIASDDPNIISKNHRVELKKCRHNVEEQEFELKPIGAEDGNEIVVILHKLTGVYLSSALDSKSPFFNITQVFEDGLFEGSGDYFFLKVVSNINEGRLNNDGSPYGPTHSYLGSGHFGEKEYSLVKTHSLAMERGFDEQEFAMWRFQPVIKDESRSSAVDEHAQWLARMTQMIGIDYLVQLPPWHLLDVERDAAKSDVKSRFRELSRNFHPDKVQSEKKELHARIFVLLQNAYQGLKSADESEKEKFRVQADSGSQLFSHSKYVVELLPFHWSKLDNTTEGENSNSRYILNAASHLNSTLVDDSSMGESEPSVQLWVTFMYSARCGMSRTVGGFVDLAARHLEQYENIKVGAYGCGLYPEYPPKKNDPTGVTSDPICAQFQRSETPNVHLIVETIPGRRRDEKGNLVEVPPDMEILKENSQFKFFYAAVPHGNTTQFYPQNFIDFALAGKRIWQNNYLIHKMTSKDVLDPHFIGNASIVAYLDGTGNGETDSEVVDAITNSLPGVARRFLNDDVYVGTAHCGHDDTENPQHVDCSKLDVSWLPDIKVYGVGETEGVSLLRGQFSDMRDVQIALESMGNVLRMMLGGTDDVEDDFEEILDEDYVEEGGGGCENKQPPPPPEYDLDLDEIEGRTEDTPLLEMQEEEADETKPALDTESKPVLEQGTRKPKLASGGDRPHLSGGRENVVRDRISGFHKRETKRGGGGQLLGGGSGGSAGFIA